MVARIMDCVGKSPMKVYLLLSRMVIAVRLWDASLRLASIERRRRDLDARSRWAILHRLELERRRARLSGQTLIPTRGSAPVLVRSMGRAVAR